MITISLTLDPKGKSKNGEEKPVYIRIISERKPYYINTGVRVCANEWRANSVINRPDSDMLNHRLKVMMEIVGLEIDDCIMNRHPLDLERVRKSLKIQTGETPNSFIEWANDQLPALNLAGTTLKKYECTIARIEEFGRIRSWRDLTTEKLYEFDSWLHARTCKQKESERLAGDKPRKISDTGVHNYHKNLKALLNRAVKMGKITANPYDRLRGEFKRGDKQSVPFLSEDEKLAIESLLPVRGSQLAVARDLFVFQMHTGLSYSDTQAFDFTKYKQVNGRWTFIGPRVKTGVEYMIQLDSECEEILERYGWNLPRINNADYNHALKAIGLAAGISTPLHSHIARHTFATYMLSKNAPLAVLAKMMGHTNTVQTQRYAKVLAQSVFEEFTRIEKQKKKQ